MHFWARQALADIREEKLARAVFAEALASAAEAAEEPLALRYRRRAHRARTAASR